MDKSKMFKMIADALLIDYSSIYCVNASTEEYCWCSVDPDDHVLKIEKEGRNFFGALAVLAEKIVYKEDQHFFLEDLSREKLLKELKTDSMRTVLFRLMEDEIPVYYSLRLIKEFVDDDEYFILGVRNVDDEIRKDKKEEKLIKERRTFIQIAESLASNYDVIYYVDPTTGVYTQFAQGDIYGNVKLNEEGNDFFAECKRNSADLIHPEDIDRVLSALDRDYIITALEEKKNVEVSYRLMISGHPQQTRLTMMWASDRKNFIIGVENIEEEVRREKEFIDALRMANEMARRDELTGVKNKKAYSDIEYILQKNLEENVDYLQFAIAVCDVNDLKEVNDLHGHKAGDRYLAEACTMICDVFSHSPVFRIGGDEFAVILLDRDYYERERLLGQFRMMAIDNLRENKGPVTAIGLSVYDPKRNESVSDVFETADRLMYENKEYLKEIRESDFDQRSDSDFFIPDERKKSLDKLFEAFSAVAEDSYVFICDMKYDYSRWSESAVTYFGLPGEYMIHAVDIWADHVHPEDRKAYLAGIDDIFAGEDDVHDMQYRAKKKNGRYDVCTCRGKVLKGKHGELDYLVGSIRNHDVKNHVDNLTGLKNQYGFFEDLKFYLAGNNRIHICMIGISKFSEINGIYGYDFGNKILQKLGRYMFENIGNAGRVYRLDGTKFAVVSHYFSSEEIKYAYDELRDFAREGFKIDDSRVILEMNGALMSIKNLNIDQQTVYSCLNYAYAESKNMRRGRMVEFSNDISEENTLKIEKLNAVRAAVSEDFKGFYLHYQPVVDAADERLIGAEALLRWKSDEYGIVRPDEFIPFLETDPLFLVLGRWILKTAVSDAKRMLKDNEDFIINVNLSYTQLEDPGFLDMVSDVLEETEYPPGQLCLEITERCRLLDIELVKNVTANLQAKGIKIALDDFGTGFSSVGLVKDLPIDTIKVDRSFVIDIEEKNEDQALVKNIAEVASIYSVRMCVEGVETKKMGEILKGCGADSFQGFYYARPLDINDLIGWKKENDNQ